MTLKEAIKKYRKIRKTRWKQDDNLNKYYITLNMEGQFVDSCNEYVVFGISFFDDDWEEYKEDILDEKEKEYLSAVIKPFRDRVTYIKKVDTYFGCNKNCEYIFGKLSNKDTVIDVFTLPWFPKGSMYKGMKLGKEYTLKELGL